MRANNRGLTVFWTVVLIGAVVGGVAQAQSYVDAYVHKDGQAYPDQSIVDVLYSDGFSTNKYAYSTYTRFKFTLFGGDATGTVKLHLLNYGEQVDHWEGDVSYTESDGQVAVVNVTEGLTETVHVYLASTPSRHPHTIWDSPAANTLAGSVPLWGSRSMTQGVMRLYSGDFTEHVTDLHVKGRGLDFVFARRYLSKEDTYHLPPRSCMFTPNGWDFSFNIIMWAQGETPGTNTRYVKLGNNRVEEFTYKSATGIFTCDGIGGKLVDNGTGNPMLYFNSGVRWSFGGGVHNSSLGITSWRPTEIRDNNGNTIAFSQYVWGVLREMTDSLGRTYRFSWQTLGGVNRLTSIEEVSGGLGRIVEYAYYDGTEPENGNAGDLKRVTYRNSSGTVTRAITYTYSESADPELNGNLLTITDSENNTVLTNEYGTTGFAKGRVVRQTRDDGAGKLSATNYHFEVLPDGETTGEYYLTITNDGEGGVSECYFNDLNQLVRTRVCNGRAPNADAPTSQTANRPTTIPDGPAIVWYETTNTWNQHDHLLTTEGPDSVLTTYAYHAGQDLFPMLRGYPQSVTRSAPGEAPLAQDSPGYTENETYITDYVEDEEDHRTDYTYDGNGNLSLITYPTGGGTEEFQYNAHGQVTLHKHPATCTDDTPTPHVREDVYIYNSDGDPWLDEIQMDVDGGSYSTRVRFQHNTRGLVTERTDNKNNTWTYAYTVFDELQTVTSPVPGGDITQPYVTAYDYDDNGNLLTITETNVDALNQAGPDFETVYVYDALQRVKTITADATGLSAITRYTYDKNGNTVVVETPLAVSGTEPANKLERFYDGCGALYRTFENGGTLRTDLAYDSAGRLFTKTVGVGDPNQQVYTYMYDGFSRLEKLAGPRTAYTEYEYNPRSLTTMTETKDASDAVLHRTVYTYDALGRVTNTKVNNDPIGNTTEYTPGGQVFKSTNPESETWTTIYDTMGRLAKSLDPVGSTVEYQYDENGNVQHVIQRDFNEATTALELPLTTTYAYDNLDRRISTTDMANKTTYARYDSRDNVGKTVDAKSDYTVYAYDGLGRNTSQAHYDSTAAHMATVQQGFDLNGRMITRTDPKNYTTQYTYDMFNRSDGVIYADGSRMAVLAFDAFGRATQVRKPDGTVVTNTYDVSGNLLQRETAPASGVMDIEETYTYDDLDRVLSETMAATDASTMATSTAYAYDDWAASPTVAKTVTLGSLSGRTTTTTYNQAGQVIQKDLPGGRSLNYVPSPTGQLREINDGASAIAAFKYIGGRKAQRELGGGSVSMDFAYNPTASGFRVAGLTQSVNAATVDTRVNTWDDNYNRLSRTISDVPAPVQQSVSYEYDGLNRMKQSDDGATTTPYTFDSAGNRTMSEYDLEGSDALMHQYSETPQGALGYDPAGRMSQRVNSGQAYVYDAMGRLKELRIGAGFIVEESPDLGKYTALSGTWAIHAEGYLHETGAASGRLLRLAGQTPTDLAAMRVRYRSTHDPADPDGEPGTADYDHEYYAEVILRAEEDAGEWSYLGLVIQPHALYLREWTDDDVIELAAVEDIEVTQDVWHEIEVVFSGSANDEVTVRHTLDGATEPETLTATTTLAQAGVVGFGVGEKGEFHFEDLRIDAPSVTPVTVALRYHYDVQGRVVGRTLNPGTPEEESLFYIYDGARIAEQVDGDGDLVAAWDYGPYIDEPVAMHRDTTGDGILDATWYYLHDDLYNVVGLVDAATDAVVERYSYDDYGMPTVWVEDAQNPGAWIEHTTANGSPASAIGNPFMFTGRRWDPQLRLYDYRTRYYDPALGRFLRIDTIGLYGDPTNLGNPYTYVGNNPWTYTDPYGEDFWDWAVTGEWNPADNVRQAAYQGFGLGASEGATVVADAATFGWNEELHARSQAIQADALERGDWMSQVGFGLGKLGVEAGYAALGGVAAKGAGAAVRGAVGAERAAAFTVQHAGTLRRVAQGGAVVTSFGAGWSAGTAFNAGMEKDWNTATHCGGRAVILTFAAWESAKSAETLGEPIERHHSDPEFMGGDPKQETTMMRESQHTRLHKEMNDYLRGQTDEFGNHMRPQRGNPGEMIRSNFSREERLRALADFYHENAPKYPTAAEDFFKQHPGS